MICALSCAMTPAAPETTAITAKAATVPHFGVFNICPLSPSGYRLHDVGGERLALRQPSVPRLEARQRLALDRKVEPAIGENAETDIGERERRAADELLVGEVAIEDAEKVLRLLRRAGDELGIALRLGEADAMEEQRRHRRRHMRQLPVHPTLDLRARRRAGRVEP